MTMQFNMIVAENNPEVSLTATQTTQQFSLRSSEAINLIYPAYEGSYTVTPSAEQQTLSTANKTLTANIVVNPIPSNYGLIEYNGSYIRVS